MYPLPPAIYALKQKQAGQLISKLVRRLANQPVWFGRSVN